MERAKQDLAEKVKALEQDGRESTKIIQELNVEARGAQATRDEAVISTPATTRQKPHREADESEDKLEST